MRIQTWKITPALIVAVWLALVTIGGAQIPERFNYQARLLDGVNLANGDQTVTFQFFDDSSGGNLLYGETQTLTAIDGLVSAEIGADNPTPGSLASVFTDPVVYLELTVNGDVLLPRERILAVPYALNAGQLEGMTADEFAPSIHGHDGSDIVSGTIAAAFIDAGVTRDNEVLPTVLANDGAGSGLDADLLDGLHASMFLRSDTTDRFTTGSLIIGSSATLDVEGILQVGLNANRGNDSRILFGGPAEYLNWNGAGTVFEFTDDLHVQGNLQTTGILSVGTDDPDNDDAIRFDSEATPEHLFWDDDFGGRFQFSDDLRVQGSLEVDGGFEFGGDLSVGTGNPSDDDTIFFDSGTDEWLTWSNGLNGFIFSDDLWTQGILQVDQSIEAGGDLCVGASGDPALGQVVHVHFGSDKSEHLTYFSAPSSPVPDRFQLSAPLIVEGFLTAGRLNADNIWGESIYARGDLHVGWGSSDNDDRIHFDNDTERLSWDDSEDRFDLTNDLRIHENLWLGDSNGSRFIYFFAGGSQQGESLRWDDAADEFVFSDSLQVDENLFLSSTLFMGGKEGDQAIYFFDGGLHGAKSFLWDDSAAWFTLSDRLVIQGDLQVEDDILVHDTLQAETIQAQVKNFRIDHPLDPKNKYLLHTSIESPDMKNVYDGVVILGDDGAAWVELPAYFQALNKDYRYQLTAIGGPGRDLHVAEEIADNRFRIAGGSPGLKVSWQVTGIRCDPWANEHRTQVEVAKPDGERGRN